MTFNEWLYSQQPMQYQSSGSTSSGGYGDGQHVGITTSPVPWDTDTPIGYPLGDHYGAYGSAQTLPQQGSYLPPPPPSNYIPGSTYRPLGHYA